MARMEILMPTMGESIFECTVLKWLIKEGDVVDVDDMILEVATDKIDTEIGSSHKGKIVKFLVQEGDIAVIGNPICEIETDNVSKADSGKPAEKELEVPEVADELEKSIEDIKSQVVSSENNSGKFYSPLVLNIAREENISFTELEKISGTGLDNRVTKNDILAYLKSKTQGVESQNVKVSSETDQIVEMDRMRKVIAERMVESKRIAPHVTSFVETDMTGVTMWRNKIKNTFAEETGENITFTPILIEAVVKAIKELPGINIQVDGDKIIYKKDINVGMAVALPNGNLIVPVIHNADSYNLIGLTKKVNDLAKRARNNQLKPSELVGGTYTVTNIGTFGNLSGTPIILQPQVAIMAFGVIRKLASVIETPEGDMIGIRQKMIISHSYDHRVVDGSLGGMFVKKVSDHLEKFDVNRKIHS
jgi:2-oxoglutarate dehydrogenase E2 component (dihydrolipoamide succinyltransferase)